MNETEMQAHAERVLKISDKIFTLFDNEDVNTMEGMAILCTCLSDSFFMDADNTEADRRLELAVTAMQRAQDAHKEYRNENQTGEA